MVAFIRRVAYLAAGAVLTLLVAEGIARILPVQSALPLRDVSADNPIRRLQPNSTNLYSRDWDLRGIQRSTANNEGYINPNDYLSKQSRNAPLVAVIGDSFVASLMLQYEETFFGRLQHDLGQHRAVYSFGMDGSNAAEYLASASFVRERFAPDTLIVVITAQNFRNSVWGHAAAIPDLNFFKIGESGVSLYRAPRKSNALRRVFNQSALARYIYFNLKLDIGTMFAAPRSLQAPVAKAQTSTMPADLERNAVHYFLDKLPAASGLSRDHIVLIFDGDRARLYGAPSLGDPMFDSIKREAAEDRYRIVDLEKAFAADWQAHRHPFDWYPEEYHWNGYAHAIVERELLRLLREGA